MVSKESTIFAIDNRRNIYREALAKTMPTRKDIRVVSVRSGYSSNYFYETEKTSLAYGGPHKLTCQLSCKAGGLQKRRALKCLRIRSFITSSSGPFLYERQISKWKSASFAFPDSHSPHYTETFRHVSIRTGGKIYRLITMLLLQFWYLREVFFVKIDLE